MTLRARDCDATVAGFFISSCFPPAANLDSAGLGSHRGPKGIMMHWRTYLFCALACGWGLASSHPASAASWLEMNFWLSGPRYEGVVPPCDYPDALSKISSRFNQRENKYWVTDLKILAFDRIR